MNNMSNHLEKYGVDMVPSSPISTLLIGALNAWSYDFKNPLNQLRDRSLQLRLLSDNALGRYTEQLKQELSKLRKQLPQPTRENPYPPMDGLEAVKELEAYMREIEALRIRILSASIPPQEIVRHSENDNLTLLTELHKVDEEILRALATLSDKSVQLVKQLLEKRETFLKNFI